MPLLINKINGKVLDNLKTNINNFKLVKGEFGHGDWFKVGQLEVFLQNFIKVINSETLLTPKKNGLINNNNNNSFIEIEISY